jgi:transmembrane sensor
VEGELEVKCMNCQNKILSSTLSAGQLFNYDFENLNFTQKNVDTEKYTAWTLGKLIFADDSFNDVVKRLNRWFNVNIVIKGNVLKSYKYVASFQDESLDEILKMLEYSAPIRYREIIRKQDEDGTFQKRTIYLYYKE